MQRALKRSRKNDFWQLSATTKYLPRETRDYVPMILAAVIIAKNPAQYGFDIVPMVPTPTETVIAPAALDLRRVAEWAGVPVDDIQKLNPEFRRWTTPVKAGEYSIRVPPGHRRPRARRTGGGRAEPAERLQWHTVKKGETLASIAKKLRVNRTDLAEANYLKVNSRVGYWQEAGDSAHAVRRRCWRRRHRRISRRQRPSRSKKCWRKRRPCPNRRRHGPTGCAPATRCTAIAKKNGTTVAQLKTWNKMRGTKLNVGDRLIVQRPQARTANQ